LIGIDSGESLQVRADFGDAGSEKEESEKTPDYDDGDPVHGALNDGPWGRGELVACGDLSRAAPLKPRIFIAQKMR
jgi:hypothetical protein